MRIFRHLFLVIPGLLFAFGTFAQNQQTVIPVKWQGYDKLRSQKPNPNAKIPTFEGARIDHEAGLPFYYLRIEGQVISEATLINPVYAPFASADAALFPKSFTKASPEIQVFTHYENKQPVSFAVFSPVRRNPQSGSIEKLVSFSYSYKTSAVTQKKKQQHHRQYAANSVLRSGEWYRLGVISTGMYKIDRAFLQTLGLNPNNIDTRNIRIYGNGGGMLPQPNDVFRHDDLVENHIYVEGETDGKFDNNDFILFYGEGPHTWKLNKSTSRFEHNFNIYSDTTYYFIAVNAPVTSAPKRITTQTAATGATQTITSFNERWFHETDAVNLLKSGRLWYGEEFSSFKLSHTITSPLPIADLVAGSQVFVKPSVIGTSSSTSSFNVMLNGRPLGTLPINIRNDIQGYLDAGKVGENTFATNVAGLPLQNQLEVNLTYNQNGNGSATGRLNYIEINAERALNLYGTQQTFRSLKSLLAPVSTYQIGNITNPDTKVWDITDPVRPVRQTLNISSGSGSFAAISDSLKEYIVFSGNSFANPVAGGKIDNQNLHNLAKNPDLDLIIVSHSDPKFLSQANRLADYRRSKGLVVEVVTPQQIYNEFSSGSQDVTAIRDFMKMVYDHSNKANGELVNLLLFGSASFDYKFNRTHSNTNFVPCYQSVESLEPLTTYSSEDYYGFLDDNEGIWLESGSNINHGMDIGIGRLPARTEDDAKAMVSKIISYEQPQAFGKWRNRITFVADDSDWNMHLYNGEDLVKIVENKYKTYNIQKVYVDMYDQPSATNGQRAPEANKNIDKAVEQGSLIVNYTGHGGETGWAHEQILNIPQINNWTNADKLAFMVTATCEFGRYDDPGRASGAEYTFTNSKGGSIGLITTTRPVDAGSNQTLNSEFLKIAFEPVNGHMPTLGSLLQRTKNNSHAGINNRNFTLLADPCLTLAYPDLQANLTKINGKTIQAAAADTIRALSKVVLEGNITDANNALVMFDGKVQVTVFEKQTPIKTRGDESGFESTVNVRENIIYDGLASVKAGKFTVTFVVPKDIAYNFGFGKISLYAFNEETDGSGAYTQVVVGGSADSAQADNNPPQIALFMNDESFKFGGITSTNTTLLANLFDENGINTAGIGIGHEITATLDGSIENVIVLNDYYTADIDKFESGKVKYLFKNLAKGPHSLKVKAWDTHNNSNESYLEFIVANSEGLALEHVLNYPNPFTTHTTFHFDHNRAGDDLDIQIQIFTVSGKLIKTLNAATFASNAHIDEITWDGRDDFQDRIGKGIYVYKVAIASRRDGSKTTKFEKLVILN